MENLKISEKLFEDVIYFVLGSLDDEVKKKETPRRAVRVPAAVAALYLHCVCYVRMCVCVCLSAYARLYICFGVRAAVHARATARVGKYLKHGKFINRLTYYI